MSTQSLRLFALGYGLLALVPVGLAAAAADIPHPDARKQVLSLALRYVEPARVDPLPADLVHPFNPVAFGQPDADELAAIAAARSAEAAALNKAKPATEEDLLERIAERVAPSGTMTMNGEPLLIFGQRKLRVGDQLTVTYDGQNYSLELTNIQRLSFTLRLNRAEITRRINP